MFLTDRGTLVAALVASLAGCGSHEVGIEAQRDGFGYEVRNDKLVQIAAAGGDQVLLGLSDDFRRSATDMITFAFNSSVIEPDAQRILDGQAAWILGHPLVRLRIYGNTDLVGSSAYNYRLGQRRAEVVSAYLVSRGISASRLEAVASFGETRPVIRTNEPERLNRRTVTEVVGFVPRTVGLDFDGKRAYQVYQNYVTGEAPEPAAYQDPGQVFMPQ